MKTILFSILVFLCQVCTLHAQSVSNSVLDKHFVALSSLTDEASIAHYLQSQVPQLSLADQKEIQILSLLCRAEVYSKSKDALNDTSTHLYQEAIELVEKSNNEGLKLWVYSKVGFYFYSYSQYIDAFSYFIRVSKILDQPNPPVGFRAGEVYRWNAYFFGTIKQYELSIQYLKKGLSYYSEASEAYSTLLNAIGQMYYEKNELQKAEKYYLQSLELAKKYDYQVRYAKVLGNMALVFMKRKEWDKAELFLQEDIEISKQNNSTRNLMFARIQLSKLFLEKKEIGRAKQMILAAQEYAQSKSYLKSYAQETEEVLLQIAILEKDEKKELHSRRVLDSIRFIVSVSEGKEAFQQIELETEKEKAKWQIEAEITRAEKARIVKWSVIALCVVLLLFATLLIVMYKRKLAWQQAQYETRLLEFQLGKIQSEQKLNESELSIESYKDYLLDKQKQISDLENELKKMKIHSTSFHQNKQNIQDLLQSHLMTEENWKVFKQTFIAEESEYYQELIHRFPDLTESNLRIVLLQKLGLNNMEAAHILGVTVDAVKKAKQRLRKKYGSDFDFAIQ